MSHENTAEPAAHGYTPRTEELRGAWGQRYGSMSLAQGHAEFDRWLAQHDAEVGERVAQAIEAVLPNADTFEARLGLNAAARIAREVTS